MKRLSAKRLKLKSCPCCKGKAKSDIAQFAAWHIICTKCGMRTPQFGYPDYDPKGRGCEYWDEQAQLKAAKVWNTRLEE